MSRPELSARRDRAPRLCAAVCLAVLSFGSACRQQVDLLVVNANVYTVDRDRPQAQAFAVEAGRFVRVGATDELLSGVAAAETLDAGGRTVIPGLIDSHGHLVSHGLIRTNVDLRGTTSLSDVMDRLRQREPSLPAGEWLRGRGWDQNDWPDARYPTRDDLDAVFPGRPVYLERIDGHASVLNTVALQFVGIDRNGRTPDPVGGRIVRDERGRPTGLLIDEASDRAEAALPPPSRDLLKQAMKVAMADLASDGLTGLHQAGMGRDSLQIFRELVDDGLATLRLYAMVEDISTAFREICSSGPLLDYGGRLTVRAVKLYADGALGSRGAALLQDYADEAGNRGLMRRSPAELKDAIEEAAACGLQPAVHAIGDSANRVVLDIYEELAGRYDLSQLRPRIEHAQILHSDDLPRFRSLGVIAAMQPTHATSDMYWAEDRLGRDRLQGAYAWKTLVDLGVHVPFGSDLPVESIDPMLGLYAAVTRQDASGFPSGGWWPSERVSRDQALRGFTIEAAYAGWMEEEVGSIENGKLADFVILDSDIMVIPAEEILRARVLATYLGGVRVYDAGSLPSPSE